MPNRILYVSLLTSDKVSQLKPQEFELYTRLLLVVDDFGRFSASPIRISRSCWPNRENVTSKQVTPCLMRLHELGLIVVYTVENESFLEVTNWNQRTRSGKSKFPPPEDGFMPSPSNDGQMTVKCQSNECQETVKCSRISETYIVDGDGDGDGKRQQADKHARGSQRNVKISESEYQKLKEEFPDEADEAVEFLSKYIFEKGYKSKSHDMAIRRWVIDAVKERRQKSATKARERPKQNFEGVTYTDEQLKSMDTDPVEYLAKMKGDRHEQSNPDRSFS